MHITYDDDNGDEAAVIIACNKCILFAAINRSGNGKEKYLL